jgi:hypothetical protein
MVKGFGNATIHSFPQELLRRRSYPYEKEGIMNLVTGFGLGMLIVVLGAGGITQFAMTLSAQESEHKDK